MGNDCSSSAISAVGVAGFTVFAMACGSAAGNGGSGVPADGGTNAESPRGADAGVGPDAHAIDVRCMGVMEFINAFPREGSAGSTVVLVGTGLSLDMRLAFPGGHVATMAVADPDMNVAFFTVPDGAIEGELSVYCGSAAASLGVAWRPSSHALPQARTIAPSHVEPGGVITLRGSGLAGSSFQLSSASTPIVNSGTDTSATFALPSGSPSILAGTYRPILRGAYGAYLLPSRLAIEVVTP